MKIPFLLLRRTLYSTPQRTFQVQIMVFYKEPAVRISRISIQGTYLETLLYLASGFCWWMAQEKCAEFALVLILNLL